MDENQTTTVDKMDLRVNGSWRFVCRDGTGKEYAFHGVNKEINSAKRLCWERLAELGEKTSRRARA